MKTPKIERANPGVEVTVLKPPTVEWQSACCLILWKLGYGDGKRLRIDAADIVAFSKQFPGGAVINDHADHDHITYRLLTKDEARKEGLMR